jgi:hypothetical protein
MAIFGMEILGDIGRRSVTPCTGAKKLLEIAPAIVW